MKVLVPNLGSASFTYQVLEFPSEQIIARGRKDRIGDYEQAVAELVLPSGGVDAVALRAVHGGPKYRGTHRVDDQVVEALQQYAAAAPLHNPVTLTAIDAFRRVMPAVPIVAAFETEFHRSLPDHSVRYGLPASWTRDDEVRRYGFQGSSHQYVSEVVPHLLRRSHGSLRLVSCHLGPISSVCAILHGRSQDVTTGFSPLSGIEGYTRPGDIDPWALLHLMEVNNWSIADARRHLIGPGGGLAAVSGVTGGDIRELEQAAYAGNAAAEGALSMFCLQIRKTIGAYAVVLGGLDAIAFTGGIGESSPALRSRCCQGLEFLGVSLDDEWNEVSTGDRVISNPDSSVQVLVVATNEDLLVGRRAYAALMVSARPRSLR